LTDTEALARPVPIADRRSLMVAAVTGAVTTVGGRGRLAGSPWRSVAVRCAGTAARAQSMPHWASSASAPG